MVVVGEEQVSVVGECVVGDGKCVVGDGKF